MNVGEALNVSAGNQIWHSTVREVWDKSVWGISDEIHENTRQPIEEEIEDLVETPICALGFLGKLFKQ